MCKPMAALTGKLAKELKTILAMTHIYCRDQHGSGVSLCDDCLEFTRFAEFRLTRCPYGQEKPTCRKCPVHCYRQDMKALARTIMVYSGPKMLLRHPFLAIRHLLHDQKKVFPLPKKRKNKTPPDSS